MEEKLLKISEAAELLNVSMDTLRRWDENGKLIAIKKEVATAVPLSKEGFGDYFADFVYRAHKKGFKITEVGYTYSYRPRGTSKLDTGYARLLKFGWQYGIRMLKIRFAKEK